MRIEERRLRDDAELALQAVQMDDENALLALGDAEDIAKFLTRAVQRWPEHFHLWYRKGRHEEILGRTEEARESYSRAIALIGDRPSRTEVELLTTAFRSRALLLKDLGLAGDARQDIGRYCRIKGLPVRRADAPPVTIDLSLYVNFALRESIHDQIGLQGNDFRELPLHIQDFGTGQLFDVRGLISLDRNEAGGRDISAPEAVRDIRVQRRLRRLHCLISTGWWVKEGTQIAALVLHYTHGQRSQFPIQYGIHVRDMIWPASESTDAIPEQHGALVWTGANALSNNFRSYLREYASRWDNPHPDLQVATVDFISTMTACAPLLVAMSVEP